MENTPLPAAILLIAGTAWTLWMLYRSMKSWSIKSRTAVLSALLAWLGLQALLAYRGFFANYPEMPPRLVLFSVAPMMLLIIVLMIAGGSRRKLLTLDSENLAWLHTVRLPVEICLYLLCTAKLVSPEMTFEGRNFDILSGITAPFIAWFGFRKQKAGRTALIAWNLVCLALLFNIVFHAVLSTPFPFQKFGIGQPNIAVFYFPFIWLPGFIVPAVFFSHLVSLAKLIGTNKTAQ